MIACKKIKLISVIFSLILLFAAYDLTVLAKNPNANLFNVLVNDGHRVDESYSYIAGVEKPSIYDPYLFEHKNDLTLRPPLPHFIFKAIYYLCYKHINVAIMTAHTLPPIVSAVLLFLLAFTILKRKDFASFATLLSISL
ncbi:MAG: hypothetical protein K0R24_209 [Gammaproteobacteria bacterium]|jgi:hypothetical protein|nr:hypothetical protein [Gammaproteobacteria bacterium]